MVIVALLASIIVTPDSDLGKPVAEHSYYLQIENKLKDGTPDEKANSNHWTRATDRFYAYVDTRNMTREADGTIHLPSFDFKQTETPVAYKQVGRAQAGLSADFHYIIGPTSAGTTSVSNGAYAVASTQNVLEYVVGTTLDETEVRLVNGKRVTRTQSHVVYGTRFIGLALNEDYDPVTEKRSVTGLRE